MAELIIQEKGNSWQGTETAQLLLEKLEANPFVSFQTMRFDGAIESQPYIFNKALQHLERGKSPSVRLEAETPWRFRGSIARGEVHNTLVLGTANPNLARIGVDILLAYGQELAALLPVFSYSRLTTNGKPNEFYSQEKLAWLPVCFGNFLGWYHLISPLGYEPYFSRKKMLNIPAHQVRELENGWVEIISYPDPLVYDQPEARAKIIEITKYLNTLSHDWQPASETKSAR